MSQHWQRDDPLAAREWEEPWPIPWPVFYLAHVMGWFIFGASLEFDRVPVSYRWLCAFGALGLIAWSAGPLIRRVRHGDRHITKEQR